MALDPHDIPLTREEVAGWLKAYKRTAKAKRKPIREYLTDKIEAKEMGDTEVNTVGHDNLRDATPLVDMILADLESYGF